MFPRPGVQGYGHYRSGLRDGSIETQLPNTRRYVLCSRVRCLVIGCADKSSVIVNGDAVAFERLDRVENVG